jgi:peptide/nickel transport system permease protein
MLAFTLRRLAHAAITFLGITIVVFLLVHAAPGDPVSYFIGGAGAGGVSPAIVAALRAEYHLDDPLPERYVRWLAGVVTLDLGRSFVDRRPVTTRIAEKLPNTLLLNLLALGIALVLAVPSGLLSALRHGGWFDRASGLFFFLLFSLPSFWVALLLMQLLSVRLGWLPLFCMTSGNYDELTIGGRIADRTFHLILPVVTLAYAQLAVFARFTRAALLETGRKEFITAAIARGLSRPRAMAHHALRNALIPLIALLGLVVPYLISGSVIIERIFQWDGVGRLFFESILARDYPMIMGLTIATAILTLLASFLTDVCYTLADPRVRLDAGTRGEG